VERVQIESLRVRQKSALRNLRSAILIGALLFAPSYSASAQQPKKISRVGFIGASSPSSGGHYLEAFRHSLRDLAYVEGENILIEVRWAEGSAGRFPRLIAELIGLKVDVLFVSSAPGALPAKNAGITTLVVFATQ
jgi:putative ABC transport system substrate-binding protein